MGHVETDSTLRRAARRRNAARAGYQRAEAELRTVIVQARAEGMKLRRIAELIGCTEQWVSYLLKRPQEPGPRP